MKKVIFFLAVVMSFFIFSSGSGKIEKRNMNIRGIKGTSEQSENNNEENNKKNVKKSVNTTYSYTEHIRKMTIDIQINKNGTLLINEKILYFAPSIKHGIFRDIPVSKDPMAGNDIGVKINYIARNGYPEPYKRTELENVINYRIGNPKTYINGENEYDINYVVYGAVEKIGKNKYEIGWNAVGQYWNFPILESEVKIHFEGNEEIKSDEIVDFEGFTGSDGSTEKDFLYEVNKNSIDINTEYTLNSNEGFTFFLTLNTEKINMGIADWVESFFYKNMTLGLSVIALFTGIIYMGMALISLGKNPVVDPEKYKDEIPKDVSPAFLSYLRGEKKASELISIAIISLTAKRHMKMVSEGSDEYELMDSYIGLSLEEKELKELLAKQKDDKVSGKYKFSNIPDIDLSNFQSRIVAILEKQKFGMYVNNKPGMPMAIMLPLLTIYGIYKISFMLVKDVGGSWAITANFSIWTLILLYIITAGNVSKNIWKWYFFIGIMLGIVSQNFLVPVVWVLFGIIDGKFRAKASRFTEYGADINAKVKGLANYLKEYKKSMGDITSSEEMLNFLGLVYPYLLASGIKKDTDNIFENTKLSPLVSTYQVEDNFHRTYSNTRFRNQIGTSCSHAQAVTSSSSSSGGSHSSGGGSHSSGGGHGGGGGGSW